MVTRPNIRTCHHEKFEWWMFLSVCCNSQQCFLLKDSIHQTAILVSKRLVARIVFNSNVEKRNFLWHLISTNSGVLRKLSFPNALILSLAQLLSTFITLYGNLISFVFSHFQYFSISLSEVQPVSWEDEAIYISIKHVKPAKQTISANFRPN